jgi:hypothetical protein
LSNNTRADATRGRFVLVGCSDVSTDEPCEGQDLSLSPAFAAKCHYADAATQWAGDANQQANTWAILSADHGVVPPRHEIEPVGATVADLRSKPLETDPQYELPTGEPVKSRLDQWALSVRTALADWLRRPYRADQTESPCRELVVVASDDYVDALRERKIFEQRPRSLATGQKQSVKTLPPKATVRFPFQDQNLTVDRERHEWLIERAELLRSAPTQTGELSAFGGGYSRDRARWQVDRPSVDVEETEQASLDTFEDLPDRFIATEQRRLDTLTDGGRTDV